jgi:hypothetical protein
LAALEAESCRSIALSLRHNRFDIAAILSPDTAALMLHWAARPAADIAHWASVK